MPRESKSIVLTLDVVIARLHFTCFLLLTSECSQGEQEQAGIALTEEDGSTDALCPTFSIPEPPATAAGRWLREEISLKGPRVKAV